MNRRKITMNVLLGAFIILSLCACSIPNADTSTSYESTQERVTDNSAVETEDEISQNEEGEIDLNEDTVIDVSITINNEVFSAKFYNNESAQTIVSRMPFSLDMGDYARQEKVTDLTFDLPAANTETPDMIRSGELYLWSGNSLVLFYTTFSNAYSYVPIGYIEDSTELAKAVGGGSVTVSFSLAERD